MVVLLAVLGALLFALAGAAEQRAASRLVRPPTAARCAVGCRRQPRGRIGQAGRGLRRGLGLARGFLSSPLWVAGWAADAMGFGAQAGALHFGSLSVVQPLLVMTLLFSLPLAALGTRRAPRWTDWAGGIAACGGLALVLSTQAPDSGAAVHKTRLLIASLAVLVVTVSIVTVVARSGSARSRSVALAVATGMMFALSATLTKLVSDRLATTGIGGTAVYWPAYALAAVALTGLVLEQAAFSSGSLPGAMAAITITDPLLSYGLGVVGFGESPPHGAGVGLSVLGVGLLAAGVVALARSPLLTAPRQGSPPSQVPLPEFAAARVSGAVPVSYEIPARPQEPVRAAALRYDGSADGPGGYSGLAGYEGPVPAAHGGAPADDVPAAYDVPAHGGEAPGAYDVPAAGGVQGEAPGAPAGAPADGVPAARDPAADRRGHSRPRITHAVRCQGAHEHQRRRNDRPRRGDQASAPAAHRRPAGCEPPPGRRECAAACRCGNGQSDQR